jgi:aspartyl-tRNA(Asn)/glutamyl-tRNA(Gln) amidotransferase subunit A
VPTWDDPEDMYRTLAAAEAYAAYRDRLDAGERALDPVVVELLRFGATITAERYLEAALKRREFWTEVQRFLARFDLLITPTVAVAPVALDAWPVVEIGGEAVSRFGWTPFTYPWNLTGQPAASVPAGFTAAGLPVGLQIVGRRHADRTVLAASAAWEAASPWQARRPSLG